MSLHITPGLLNTEVVANMCLRQTVMSPEEDFETRKHLLTLSLAQPRQTTEAGF
jgi:hypothetical protein